MFWKRGVFRWIILALLFIPAIGLCQEKPAQVEGKLEAPKKATVEGEVIDAITSKPVKDVTLLMVSSVGAGTPLTAKADETGKFLIKDLDAGTFVLMADHPRYARQTYGSRNGLLGGTLLTIASGQSLKALSFKLQPNAVASGRVLDADGDPIQQVMVAALKGMYQRGKRQFMPLGTGVTNDQGEFRVANLAAGRYLLVALIMNPNQAVIKASGDTPEQAYVPTYYPNATEFTAAAPIDIAAGRDVAGLDIRLAKEKSVRVKGSVAGATKDQKVNVRLVPKGVGLLAMLTGKNGQVKPDGTFEIVGVTRGSYTLRPNDPSGMKPLGPGVPVEVGDRVVDNTVVDVTPASDLTGKVIIKGDNKVEIKGVRLVLEPVEGLNMIPPNTMVGEDGAFSLKDVPPDRYLVRLLNPPVNTFVDSVTIGGQEMKDDGLMLGGADRGKLEIRLNSGAAQIEGIVRGQDENPISGVTVALVPSSGRYIHYTSTFTDQNGAFSFKNMTPGEYKVFAWEEVEPNAFQDPEFLKPFESKGERVSVKENGRQSVTLKAIPRT